MRSRGRHTRGTAVSRPPAITEKELEARLGRVPVSEPKFIGLESPVEDLGLSVRTRNALRAIGCDTVEHVLGLDLSASVRGLGTLAGLAIRATILGTPRSASVR